MFSEKAFSAWTMATAAELCTEAHSAPPPPASVPVQLSARPLSSHTRDISLVLAGILKSLKIVMKLTKYQAGKLNILMYFSFDFKSSLMISEDLSRRG